MIEVIKDIGKGRTFIILQEAVDDQDLNYILADNLSQKSRVVIIKTPLILDNNWKDISSSII